MIDRVLLVGFMCSGKSTVGRLLAQKLGWRFVDFDERIQAEAGATIAELFAGGEDGEAGFRRLERDLTDRLASERRVVLAPGGGWITQPGLLEALRPRALTVWLQIQPETVLRRHERQRDVERPLLDVEDPLARITELMAAREPFYSLADCALRTDDRSPGEVAGEIAGLAQGEAGS